MRKEDRPLKFIDFTTREYFGFCKIPSEENEKVFEGDEKDNQHPNFFGSHLF